MPRFLVASAAAVLLFLALASPARAAWVWPLRGEVITPYSNGADPYAGGQHRGIDIAGETGEPVVAAAGGSVRFAGVAGSSGLTVSIRTTDGFDTSYLHLSAAAVVEGGLVAAGERIGAVGTSGTRSAEAAHLHFGVRDAGSRHAYRDPLALLPALPAPPEGPRASPAPLPAPAPVAPSTAPTPIPSGERAPAVRRQATVDRPVPQRDAAPAADTLSAALSPAPAAHAVASRPAEQGSRSLPAPQLSRMRPSTTAAQSGARSVGVAANPAADPDVATAPRTPAQRLPAQAGPRGTDWGLVLACLGLLGAAALLGLSEDGRAATRRTGRRAAGLLRPLVGRG